VRFSILILVLVGGLAGVVYVSYGTLDPCGILRERVRHQAAHEGGGFGSFLATALPDNVVDGIIAAQHGPLSPGRCISLLFDGSPSGPTVGPRRP
jgi:hypothetical protein